MSAMQPDRVSASADAKRTGGNPVQAPPSLVNKSISRFRQVTNPPKHWTQVPQQLRNWQPIRGNHSQGCARVPIFS